MSSSAPMQAHAGSRNKPRHTQPELAHHLAPLANRHDERRVVKTGDEENLSPIQRAPEDILHNIFNLCLSDNDLTIDNPNHPTVALSHVCRSWRELLMGHSPYWSNIKVVTPPIPICERSVKKSRKGDPTDNHRDEEAWKATMKRVMEAARTFIARSEECPMNITIQKRGCTGYCEDNAYEMYCSTYSSLVQLLCSASQRWSKCSLDAEHCFCTDTALETVSNLKANDVPILASLKWRAKDLLSFFNSDSILQSSSLKELHLLRGYLNEPWVELMVNWASLTELHYDGFDCDSRGFGPRSALALLKRCPSLVTCSLAIFDPADIADIANAFHDFPDEHLESPVELVHLRNLTITGYTHAADLCDFLHLPSLQELHLHKGNPVIHGDVSSPDCVFPWIQNYGDVVVSLSVVLRNFSPEDALKVLTLIPAVRSLSITIERGRYNAKTVAETILDALTPQLDESGALTKPYLCTGLRKFGLSQYTDAFREMEIVEFVKGRRSSVLRGRGGSAIEDVDIVFACPKWANVRSELIRKGVDMKGLSVTVEYLNFWDASSDEEDEFD